MKRRSKNPGTNAIAAGKAFAEMSEVGESSEARCFFPEVDWSTVPPERERMISKRLTEMLVSFFPKVKADYWLKVGIDIHQVPDCMGRMRLLAAKAGNELGLAAFDRSSWFHKESPERWLPALNELARRNTKTPPAARPYSHSGDKRKPRKNEARDATWLQWSNEGLFPSQIRDRWNIENPNDQIAMKADNGISLVKKAIKREKERQLKKIQGTD